jgi:hypothetical protein
MNQALQALGRIIRLPSGVLALCAIALLPGCAMLGSTWSELTGIRYNRTIENRVPVAVAQVDQQGTFGQSPIRLEPGRRVIYVDARPPGTYASTSRREITIVMEPCKRYYVNAQFKSLSDADFTPVIDHVEEIAGCKVPGK